MSFAGNAYKLASMKLRAWVWIGVAGVVLVSGFFLVGRMFVATPQKENATFSNISEMAKLTNLDLSIDPKDKSTVIVFRQLKDGATIGQFTVATLEAVTSLKKVSTQLANFEKVRFNLKSGHSKRTFEIKAETLISYFNGEFGEKTLWGEILADGTPVFAPTDSGYGKEDFKSIFESLEPSAEMSFDDDTFKIGLGLSRSWQSEAASVMVSISSASEVSGFWPTNIEMIVTSDGTQYLLAFKSAALRDVASGKTSPQEFVAKLHLEKK